MINNPAYPVYILLRKMYQEMQGNIIHRLYEHVTILYSEYYFTLPARRSNFT